jgi:hypothetical protein
VGWFSRDKAGAKPDAAAVPSAGSPADVPERPSAQALTNAERTRIWSALATLEAAGVDVDDLTSLSTAYDAARTTWEGAAPNEREDSGAVVERFALGIGEHLNRHTDLTWSIVTDGFGTDLGLMGRRDDTVVVPHNLVGARWLNGERGWIPGVVAHLVRTRAAR